MADRPSSGDQNPAITLLGSPQHSITRSSERRNHITDTTMLSASQRMDDQLPRLSTPPARTSRISRASQRLSSFAQKLHLTKAPRIYVRDVVKNVDIDLGDEPLSTLEIKLRLLGSEYYPDKFLSNIILLNARTRYEFEDNHEILEPSSDSCAVMLFSKSKSSDDWEQVFIDHAQAGDVEGLKRAIDTINRARNGPKQQRSGEETAGATLLNLLRCAAETGLDVDVESTVHAVLHAGASLDVCDEHGWTPLHFACNHGNAGLVRMFLGSPTCNVNAVDGCQFTPLHYACLSLCTEAVASLIENKANVNAPNDEGKTALDFAKSSGQTEIVCMLAEASRKRA